jgi:5'-methylthioadenosine phosphorylase
VKSPWGEPSDALLFGNFRGVDLVFLPRHGRGHVQSPTSINYRANIDALKRAGVTDVISVSACGSLKEELPPGTFVMVDQFIDRTFAREKSFFGPGFVAHVSMAHPVCPRLSGALADAAREAGIAHAVGGTYLAMEGPQFSTLAESNLYRTWGCAVIGMTAMPEAKLAREAELPYALVAMVTDYDCWHEDHDHVTVDQVVKVLVANADNARRLVMAVAPRLGPERTPSPLGVETVLDTAIITAPEKTRSGPLRQTRCGGRPAFSKGRGQKEASHESQNRHPQHSRLSQEGDRLPGHHHPSRQSARLPRHGGCAGAALRRGADRQGGGDRGARFHPWRRHRPSIVGRLRAIRKKGKLPHAVIGEDYDLEYGTDRVEIHADAVKPGENVVLVDDLIATGGTAFAAIKLLERVGAKIVGCAFVIDLPDLGGADKIRALGKDVTALVSFAGH